LVVASGLWGDRRAAWSPIGSECFGPDGRAYAEGIYTPCQARAKLALACYTRPPSLAFVGEQQVHYRARAQSLAAGRPHARKRRDCRDRKCVSSQFSRHGSAGRAGRRRTDRPHNLKSRAVRRRSSSEDRPSNLTGGCANDIITEWRAEESALPNKSAIVANLSLI